jgi:hypothetical protein
LKPPRPFRHLREEAAARQKVKYECGIAITPKDPYAGVDQQKTSGLGID